MGLDLHVMPLSRFLAGAFQSPLEKLLGDKVQRLGSAKPSHAPDAVRNYVSSLQERLRPAATGDVRWNDGGESVFSEQYDASAFVALCAFAAHQEYPKTTGFFRKRPAPFSVEEKPNRYPGLVRVLDKGAPTAYPHLIHHHSIQGYYLPVDFPKPLSLSEETWLMAGSSVRLLEELGRLAKILNMTRDWAQLETGEAAAPQGDPLGPVKYGWSVLHAAARLSVEHRLPIIFDG